MHVDRQLCQCVPSWWAGVSYPSPLTGTILLYCIATHHSCASLQRLCIMLVCVILEVSHQRLQLAIYMDTDKQAPATIDCCCNRGQYHFSRSYDGTSHCYLIAATFECYVSLLQLLTALLFIFIFTCHQNVLRNIFQLCPT